MRAAGAHIALFGGLMAAFDIAVSALFLWVMAYPGIAQEAGVLRALYYIVLSIGGVGFSVPMGLLIAGLSVPALIMKFLPKYSSKTISQFHLVDSRRILPATVSRFLNERKGWAGRPIILCRAQMIDRTTKRAKVEEIP